MGFTTEDEEYVFDAEAAGRLATFASSVRQRSIAEQFQEEFTKAVAKTVERSLMPTILVPDAPGVLEALRRAGVAVPPPSLAGDGLLGDPATRLIRE